MHLEIEQYYTNLLGFPILSHHQNVGGPLVKSTKLELLEKENPYDSGEKCGVTYNRLLDTKGDN